MKNFKILIILILLMGFGKVYSQQTTSGQQKNDQIPKTVQQDRSALSPNPASGDPAIQQNSGQSAGTQQSSVKTISVADAESSPNKPSDPASPANTASNSQVKRNTENVGPSPNDPNGRKPDTK